MVGFFWRAPLLLTGGNTATRRMQFLWGNGGHLVEDKRLDLGIGDESHTKQGVTDKEGLKTRKCFLYCKIHQVGSRYLKRDL